MMTRFRSEDSAAQVQMFRAELFNRTMFLPAVLDWQTLLNQRTRTGMYSVRKIDPGREWLARARDAGRPFLDEILPGWIASARHELLGRRGQLRVCGY